MTRRVLRFLWIDDNPDRERTSRDLGTAVNAEVEFISLRNEDVLGALSPRLGQSPPDLVILDHVLDKASSADGMLSRGASVAEALRERWPACPIAGITAASNLGSISIHQEEMYDALYAFTDFHCVIPNLPVIAADFAKLKRARFTKVPGLVKRLAPPKADVQRLEAVVPDDLRKAFRDRSYPSRVFRWVQGVLVGRPGFLYDKLWVATLLGLKPSGFDKVAARFSEATYSGVFALPSVPRWWVSTLKDLLLAQFPNPPQFRWPWELGSRLPGVAAKDRSRCERCGQPFPEIVGHLDETGDLRRPLHIRCSVLHPRYSSELFFEDIRLMED